MSTENFCKLQLSFLESPFEKDLEFFSNLINGPQNCFAGFSKYANEFIVPYLLATHYFADVEGKGLFKSSPFDIFKAYSDLFTFNLNIFSRGAQSSMEAMSNYGKWEMKQATQALLNTIFGLKGENIINFITRQSNLVSILADDYPKAILDIEEKYGFHFERGENEKVAETDRFIVYMISPLTEGVSVDMNKKPLLIIPPYVLGANILSFLPKDNRSYTHCFANQGIPTYIRIMKDIAVHEAVQVMTPEDDALDTRYFCEIIQKRHTKPITLNGYCQGGYMAVCNILSGELDGLVDTLITCVSPMDGTRSQGLAKFLNNLPSRFNNLAYGAKTLPNGNKVADGRLMGWVYKLKSIEHESPIVAYCRDLMMFSRQAKPEKPKIGDTAAAINYWLNYERNDLPLAITDMSFKSYNIPITEDGTLPVTLFGRKLNLKRINEKNIKWLICYGINDDLVEKETALAPLDYIQAEVSAFPKGHVAIATSWSYPTSECSLTSYFGDNYKGPVRYQLDLDEEIDKNALKIEIKAIEETATPKAEGLEEAGATDIQSKPVETSDAEPIDAQPIKLESDDSDLNVVETTSTGNQMPQESSTSFKVAAKGDGQHPAPRKFAAKPKPVKPPKTPTIK